SVNLRFRRNNTEQYVLELVVRAFEHDECVLRRPQFVDCFANDTALIADAGQQRGDNDDEHRKWNCHFACTPMPTPTALRSPAGFLARRFSNLPAAHAAFILAECAAA